MSKILAIAVKKLAEGDFGAGPAKAYWWLAGKKTWIAFAVGVAAYGLNEASGRGLCDPCQGYVATLGTAAAVLAAAGLYDGALRTSAPQK
jgi:hypothetical protein